MSWAHTGFRLPRHVTSESTDAALLLTALGLDLLNIALLVLSHPEMVLGLS